MKTNERGSPNVTAPSDTSSPAATARSLGDERLMMFLDDELGAEELAELELELESIPELQRKLVSLEVLGAVLRHNVERDARADGLADAVMAAIDAEDAVKIHEKVSVIAAERGEGGQAQQQRSPRREQPRSATVSANDNAKGGFVIAALAVAAAVALFAWGRTVPTERSPAVAALPETRVLGEAPAGAAAALMTSPLKDQEQAKNSTMEPGVEVASVEFGSRAGSVFYVPGEGTGTTVIWINDTGDEE